MNSKPNKKEISFTALRLILFLRDHSLLNGISLISKMGYQLNFICKPIFILHICFLVDTLVMYMFFIYLLTFPMTLLMTIKPGYLEEEIQQFPGDELNLTFCKTGYKWDFFYRGSSIYDKRPSMKYVLR